MKFMAAKDSMFFCRGTSCDFSSCPKNMAQNPSRGGPIFVDELGSGVPGIQARTKAKARSNLAAELPFLG